MKLCHDGKKGISRFARVCEIQFRILFDLGRADQGHDLKSQTRVIGTKPNEPTPPTSSIYFDSACQSYAPRGSVRTVQYIAYARIAPKLFV